MNKQQEINEIKKLAFFFFAKYNKIDKILARYIKKIGNKLLTPGMKEETSLQIPERVKEK